jgi:hypothetical protein
MATVTKIRRIANPRRKAHSFRPRNKKGHFLKASAARRKNTAHRKRSNPSKSARRGPVIKRYSSKTLKRELKRRGIKIGSNPRRTVRRKVMATKHHRTVKKNPVLIELGMLNPRKRSNRVAKARRSRKSRSHNPRRRYVKAAKARRTSSHRRRTAPNPAPRRRRRVARRYGVARRRMTHNPRTARRMRRYSSRNPFGTTGKQMFEIGGGILVGVAATKYIPTLIPSSVSSMVGGGTFGAVLMTGAGAFAAGWLAQKFIPGSFAQGVFYGGIAQTISSLLNAIAPPQLSGALALSGVGDIIPTQGFTVPNPSVRAPLMMAAPAAGGGMAAPGFRGAFMRR